MNKMKKIKVILSAVLFVALSGICSCNDKPQETVTQQPQPGHHMLFLMEELQYLNHI